MNRKLYTRMLQILFAVLLSLATACDEDNGGGNEDPKPSKFSVTLSVKDVSASTASVETTPNDNTVHYFCDAVTKAEYDKAGEDAFIAGLLESYEVQLEEGETFAQFWEKKSKRGKGSWTLSGLTPQTEYYMFAFAVDTNSGEVLSKVFLSEAFTTADAPTGETGPTINRLEVSPAAQDPKTKLEMELQVTDATKIYALIMPKAELDAVTGGDEQTLIATVMGSVSPLEEEQFEQAMGEGLTLLTENLKPGIEYLACVVARNDYATVVKQVSATTEGEEAPSESLYDRLPGKYKLTTRVMNINSCEWVETPVELIVEIAKGVNDATESEYRAKNRLVIKGIFGFDNGDGTAQFSSPEQMISDGIWPDEQSANKNYGPKWFLEIDENEQLSVPADLEIPVMADDTKTDYLLGYEPFYQTIYDTPGQTFPATVDEKGVITVNPFFGEYSLEYHPTIVAADQSENKTAIFVTQGGIKLIPMK